VSARLDGQVPDREALRAHLVATRIAGDVATSREHNLRNYHLLAERDPGYLFGLEPAGRWTYDDVLALMVRRVGVRPDPAYREGPDRIDPERTLERTEAVATRLRQAAERGERVLVATGHPTGLLAVHRELARALAAGGATLLTPAAGWTYDVATGHGRERREIRYVGGVGMVGTRGRLEHTHSPRPMQAMLAALDAAGEPPPDLVVADHGYAGAAGQAGVAAVGFADSNDPALFVGEAEGRVAVSVPLDDNVEPQLYAPYTRYLLHHAGL
jgi:Phosphatase